MRTHGGVMGSSLGSHHCRHKGNEEKDAHTSLGPAFSDENSTLTLFLFSKQSEDSAQRACKLKAATELSLTMQKKKKKTFKK